MSAKTAQTISPAQTPPHFRAVMASGAAGDSIGSKILDDAAREGCTPPAPPTPPARGVQSPIVLKMIKVAEWLATDPQTPDQIIPEVFDLGDKVLVIGKSKLRKSFYVLQLAVQLAAGRGFLCWPGGKPRRVLLVQMEVKAAHFHRRVKHMAAALGLTVAELMDRLVFVNGRGIDLSGESGIDAIKAAALAHKAEVIILDPLYKLARGDENLAADLKPTLAGFDTLAEQTGAAVVIVHHDPKGESGERDVRDRGAGSSILSRDYDACFALSPHAAEEGAAVVDLLLRNYPPQVPVSIGWGAGCFEVRTDLPAVKRTARTPKTGPALTEYLPAAEKLLKGGALGITEFRAKFKERTGLTGARVNEFCAEFAGEGLHFRTLERLGRGIHEKKIGTPEQIEKLQRLGGL